MEGDDMFNVNDDDGYRAPMQFQQGKVSTQ